MATFEQARTRTRMHSSNSLPTTHHSPHSLLTTHHAPRTTHHAPRTTHHAPRTTHHAPRTSPTTIHEQDQSVEKLLTDVCTAPIDTSARPWQRVSEEARPYYPPLTMWLCANALAVKDAPPP